MGIVVSFLRAIRASGYIAGREIRMGWWGEGKKCQGYARGSGPSNAKGRHLRGRRTLLPVSRDLNGCLGGRGEAQGEPR